MLLMVPKENKTDETPMPTLFQVPTTHMKPCIQNEGMKVPRDCLTPDKAEALHSSLPSLTQSAQSAPVSGLFLGASTLFIQALLCLLL